MPVEKSNIDIHPEKQEQIVMNRFYHDVEFRGIIADHFDPRHFDCESLGRAMSILVEFFKTYCKIPSKEIFRMILKKYSEKENKDFKELELKAFQAIDFKLEQTDLPFAKEIVMDFIKGKSAYFAMMDNIDSVTQSKSLASVIEAMSKIVNIEFEKNAGMDYFSEVDQASHWTEIMNPEAKLPTKIMAFDNTTNGGVPKNGKCLIVMMAPLGVGKSQWLSNIAVNFCAQGKFIIIFSLEMSEFVYAQRIDAHISTEDINCLRIKHKEAREKIQSFEKLHPGAKLLIKDYPPDTITPVVLNAYIDKQIALLGRKPDAIIVDYINLVLPSRGSKKGNEDGMYQKVGNVARELRAMSYHYECPVFSATQANRGGVNNESAPGVENISESMGIGHTADFLGVLWQKPGDREAGRLNFTTLKNRFGRNIGRTFELLVNYSNLRLTDMPHSESDEEENTENTADLQRMLDSISGV